MAVGIIAGLPGLRERSIQDEARSWNELIQKIKIAPVAGQQVTAGRSRL